MDTPHIPPVDNRLLSMLGGAKQLIKKDVENSAPRRDNSNNRYIAEQQYAPDPNSYVEREPPSMYDQIARAGGMSGEAQAPPTQLLAPVNGLPANYHKSKMPSFIKEAMKDAPIVRYDPNQAFDLSQVAALVDGPQQGYIQQVPQPQQPIFENHAPQIPQGMVLIEEAKLKQMMNDYMLEFMTKTFTKTLSEQVIKKTIGTLIKEGKITVKEKL